MAEISFITARDKLSPISEAYRAIRTNLQFAAAGDKKVKTIVFTSALPSEGKSTTDTNLAIVMARTTSASCSSTATCAAPSCTAASACQTAA